MNLVTAFRPDQWAQHIALNGQQRSLLSANNSRWLSQIVRSQRQGRTCLPYFLGLSTVDYHWMMHRQLLGRQRRMPLVSLWNQGHDAPLHEEDLRQQLLEMRKDEWLEIRNLLRKNKAGKNDCELIMSDIVAAGCLGGDHLWRDLGLQSRSELSQLMLQNFPTLAAANSGDMKWKKFFYKQLCEAGGGYVCRAPSCDQCSAYSDCFGPEE
ncbi:MAG: nitrogen fixation protein NifQ [Oleibacter sp.]|nr:nitrogen fixation protein NifQ [Thalassolituus sp.]